MIKVEINNKQTQMEIEDELLKKMKEVACKSAEIEGYSDGEISMALVDNQEIRVLNNKYRQVDKTTDVLSFPLDKELLGDIIISPERACQQAEDYGHSFARELCYLVTHGILHLLGYNHKNAGDKEQMRQKEERILSEFNLNRK